MRNGRRIGPRMSLVVDLLHPAGRQVRVDLGRAEALVPEQLLHAAQVGAVVEQVRREAVAERVGLIPGSRPACTRYLSSLRRTERVLSGSPCLLRKTRPAVWFCIFASCWRISK